MNYDLTSIKVQEDYQQAFELYANEEKEQTLAFVFDEKFVKLYAAAPELLEACKYVVNYHREHDTGEGELYGLDFVTTCIAAIAKAEGGRE